MKYIVIDEPTRPYGDIYTKEFDDLERATAEARYQAEHKVNGRMIKVIESINSDPDAENHADGCAVWSEG